jgi:hypothetical protein
MTEMTEAQAAKFQEVNDNWPIEEYWKEDDYTIIAVCEDGDRIKIYQDGTTSAWYTPAGAGGN